ncbi:hypothetical protein C8A05DRAFT_13928 [Staphylotrichum tortipilum]|uniref:Fumarylacetoacetase n=1 Tax=Staphylotrichum tortipilum TaxID=2831512 RepID=A0AAN6MNH2_9PEZI|nr:hypothetical protein C8A05DRAFT_13928 [Staphylotrichum longicolle]
MSSPDYAHHFSVRNVPFGIASADSHPEHQAVTRLENSVIFLNDCHTGGLFGHIEGLPLGIFAKSTLNAFAALPKSVQNDVRTAIQEAYGDGSLNTSVFPHGSVEDISKVQLHMPVEVGDFADFSCSLEHVQNAGRIIINDARPPPAFFHLPIAYQGRASSIVVSGTDIERPHGQFRDKTAADPANAIVYGPSRALDYEMEFAAIIGRPLPMRQRVDAADADEHIFGFVLLNDWSARDIQGYEMAPLGPFNGKNLGTTISPWVVTLPALTAFQTPGPIQNADITLPPHLRDPTRQTYSVCLQVEILTTDSSKETATVTGTSHLQTLYWTPRQMIAHAASAGAALRTGDVLATGTVSGEGDGEKGCLLELTEGGAKAVALVKGGERAFLKDGDVVRMTGFAGEGVGFGECVGRLVAGRV